MLSDGDGLRVTFVLKHDCMSGGTLVVARYAGALLARGHVPTIVSMERGGPTLRNRVAALLKHGRWPSRGGGGSWRTFFDGLPLEVKRIAAADSIGAEDVPDADVVVATYWETAEWVHALPAEKGAKVYLCQGDEAMSTAGGSRADATYGLAMTQVCVSGWVAEQIASRHGGGDRLVIPNGVDHGAFWADETVERGRTVGFVHSMSPTKGGEAAVRTVSEVRQMDGSVRVVGFGFNEPPSGAAAVFDDFVVAPSREEIRRIYSGARVWLWLSEVEGFGLPLLEAMACGTPVVATPAGVAPEVLADREAGVLVPHGDVEAAARAVLGVLDAEAAVWSRMSADALAVASGFRWESSEEAFVALCVERARRHRVEMADAGARR